MSSFSAQARIPVNLTFLYETSASRYLLIIPARPPAADIIIDDAEARTVNAHVGWRLHTLGIAQILSRILLRTGNASISLL